MMTTANWEELRTTFDDEDNFNKDGVYSKNGGYPPFDLMDWLECSTTRPSSKMIEEYNKNGYAIHCLERDSFGWLVADVEDLKTHRRIIFG